MALITVLCLVVRVMHDLHTIFQTRPSQGLAPGGSLTCRLFSCYLIMISSYKENIAYMQASPPNLGSLLSFPHSYIYRLNCLFLFLEVGSGAFSISLIRIINVQSPQRIKTAVPCQIRGSDATSFGLYP